MMSEFVLDLVQSVAFTGGTTQFELADLAATVQVRSGAMGPDVTLLVDASALAPGPTRFCQLPYDQVCTVDSDCLVPPCRPPVNLVDIPVSTDCAPGGLCDGVGKATGPDSQCGRNGASCRGCAPPPTAHAVCNLCSRPVRWRSSLGVGRIRAFPASSSAQTPTNPPGAVWVAAVPYRMAPTRCRQACPRTPPPRSAYARTWTIVSHPQSNAPWGRRASTAEERPSPTLSSPRQTPISSLVWFIRQPAWSIAIVRAATIA